MPLVHLILITRSVSLNSEGIASSRLQGFSDDHQGWQTSIIALGGQAVYTRTFSKLANAEIIQARHLVQTSQEDLERSELCVKCELDESQLESMWQFLFK